MTDGCGKTLGSGPGGLVLPGDLDVRLEDPGDGDVAVGGSATEAVSEGNDEERDWSDIDRHAERVAEVLGAVVLRASEGLERRQMMHEERVEARLEDIGGAVFRLASVQKNEAMGAQRREAAINGIRAWLESTWDRYMKGADRAEEAFQEVGRKLDWLMDDSRELRRRVSPAGRAGTGLSAALLGGLISCALLVGLAVAVGLVDVRWAPHEGGVTGANTTQMGIRAGRPGEGAARDDGARFAEGARDLNPSQGIVGAPAGVNPWYSREAEHVDERRVREAVDVMPVFERPRVAAPPDLEEGGKTVRGRRGPEEYLGRREDRTGLHPDVLTDGAP